MSMKNSNDTSWDRTSDLQQKRVPGIFRGGTGCQYVGLTTVTHSCADCFEAGNLNLLEPSGPETGLYMYYPLRIMACFITHRLKTPFTKVKIYPKI